MRKLSLNEQEKQLSYAKFFDYPLTEIDSERLSKLRNVKQLLVDYREINKLLVSGYTSNEIGYCKMNDNVACVASYTKMPNVSAKMLNWWFLWHQFESLRYIIWDKEDHFGLEAMDHAKQNKFYNKNLSLAERLWNTVSKVQEDIGLPSFLTALAKLLSLNPYDVSLHFVSPYDFGFDPQKLSFDMAGNAVCANVKVGKEKMNIAMCHFIRELEQGVELSSHFWFGIQYVNGEYIYSHNPLIKSKTTLKAMTKHCLKEYSHLAVILPELYAIEAEKSNLL